MGRSTMSRTDVHAPWWVKERDPLWRQHFQEVHDHSRGPCDLLRFLSSRRYVRTSCYIEIRWQGRQIHCGCRMCTDQVGHQLQRRHDRHVTKQALKADRWDQGPGPKDHPYWAGRRGPSTWAGFQAEKQAAAATKDVPDSPLTAPGRPGMVSGVRQEQPHTD